MQEEPLDYIWQQLYGTVSSLATGNLSERKRLQNAVSSRLHRIFHSSKKPNVDMSISERINALEDILTKHGSFEESIEKMEEREVTNTIEEIVSLFNKVARSYPDTE